MALFPPSEAEGVKLYHLKVWTLKLSDKILLRIDIYSKFKSNIMEN